MNNWTRAGLAALALLLAASAWALVRAPSANGSQQAEIARLQAANRELTEQLERVRLDAEHEAATNAELVRQIAELNERLGRVQADASFARATRPATRP
ncbi:MAG: hypothetical protein QM803_18695 [Rhodocyclaceae bacterium]